jgi:uncharacterized membrane protein YedE/YeeE
MGLRAAALGLGAVSGFVFGWARLTDPDSFHTMLGLDSPRIYLLRGAAVAVAFVGARLVRGRRALLTGEPIGWSTSLPARNHIFGGVLFGIGWGISDACPGPAAAQLGGGRLLAIGLAVGIVAGVWVQPRLAQLPAHLRRVRTTPAEPIPAGEVL